MRISLPPRTHRFALALPAVLACVLFVLTLPAGARAAEACPNEAIRAEQGAEVMALPDCMALEMVSPPQKASKPARAPEEVSADGERVLFKSTAQLAESPGVLDVLGDPYVATRTASGWSTTPTDPPVAGMVYGWGFRPDALSFTPDLSSWFQIGSTGTQDERGISQAFQGGLGGLFSPLSPLLLPLQVPTGPKAGYEIVEENKFQGASADHSHLYFQAGHTSGAEVGVAYLPGDPEPTPVSSSPTASGADFNTYVAQLDAGGEPALELLARDGKGKIWGGNCGSRLGGIGGTGIGARNQGAVSTDGSRVYFSTRPSQPSGEACNSTVNKLRILERTETKQGIHIEELFSPECARVSPACSAINGNDLYQGASTDGTKVYFTTNRQLVNSDLDGSATECSSTTGVPGCDLYLYDSTLPAGQRLVQVSAGETNLQHEAGKNADVYNGTTAISTDGSHVYFVAAGVLTEHPNPQGAIAIAGQPNLYLYERNAAYPNGHTTFVATVAAGDQGFGLEGKGLWGEAGTFGNQAYPVPATGTNGAGEEIGGDGHILVFETKASLTPNDTDGGQRDIYRYNSDANPATLECVSCRPGAPDSEPVEVELPPVGGGARGTDSVEQGRWVSEDAGSIVFQTAEALVPSDANGATDSYLWHEGGFYRLPGSTVPPPALLTNSAFGYIAVLSSDGSTVAYTSGVQLLPEDGDSVADVYVARANGGYPSPVAAVPCQAEGCQEPFSAQSAGVGAASESFDGPGNISLAPSQASKSVAKAKAKALTRSQKLAHALKTCRKSAQKQRAACERHARKRYGVRAKRKKQATKIKTTKSSGKGSK